MSEYTNKELAETIEMQGCACYTFQHYLDPKDIVDPEVRAEVEKAKTSLDRIDELLKEFSDE